MSYYCHNPGHVRWKCRRLLRKNRRFQSSQYYKSLKSASISITTLINSSKTVICFISSYSTWVIDSRTTDHMTCNSSSFTTFQSHPSTSTITLAYGSTSCVHGLETINLNPLITLTSILSLPQFSFNLIYVTKLTCILNCSISFFFYYCLIHDLLTKMIIGIGRESGGLYILDTKMPKYVACYGVVTLFELHCHLGHPSLPLLKKLYLQ